MSTSERARGARERGGWAVLDRALLEVSGPKRAEFLHNLLSNDVRALKPGESRLAALMDVKGRQIAWMRVGALADRFVCELPSDRREAVEAAFVHYKVGTPVRFAKPDTDVFAIVGAPQPLDGLPPGVVSWVAHDVPVSGRVLHVPRDSRSDVESALRSRFGEPLTKEALDTLRVEDGIPWYGPDVDESHLLHETGQLSAYHSATKGCYVGQEVIARLEGRGGNVNKRLRGLRIDSSGSARARDVVRAGGKDVGIVTTVGDSARFGRIALAYVHRSASDTGVHVSVGDSNAGATIADLPFRE